MQRWPHESQGGAVEQRVDLAGPTAGGFDQVGLVETLPRDEPDQGQSVLPGYKPRSGLFPFQASQAIERSQRPIMAE
jgi:hypothetical protein